MKSTTIIACFVLFFLGTLLLLAKSKTAPKLQTLSIKTSSICEECQNRIETGLLKLRGVKSAHLDLNTKVVTVVFKVSKLTPEQIRQTIAEMGYDADDVKKNQAAFEQLPGCCKVKMH
jgi:periplasmic mercuric ion binding protein